MRYNTTGRRRSAPSCRRSRKMGKPVDRLGSGLDQGTRASVPTGLVIVTEWRRPRAPSRSDRARPAREAQKVVEGVVSNPSVNFQQHSAPEPAPLQLAGRARLRCATSSAKPTSFRLEESAHMRALLARGGVKPERATGARAWRGRRCFRCR